MKKCRHCGTENEQEALLCPECGLDFSPSSAAQLVVKLMSVLRAINTSWLRRALVIVAAALLVLAVYLLSLGPVLRVYGAKPSNVWGRVPPPVRAVYEPQDHMPIPEPLARMLRGYNRWWMGAGKEKVEFI